MNTRRRLTGVVTSNKMEKTVLVEISRTYRHRLYKKVVSSQKRIMAHDELDCQIGDHVQIVESHPISRHKHWVVQQIIRREVGAGEPDALIDEPEFTLEKPDTVVDEAEFVVDEPGEMDAELEVVVDESGEIDAELDVVVDEPDEMDAELDVVVDEPDAELDEPDLEGEA